MSEDRFWRHFSQPRSAVGLALFRIAYSLTLLCEVGQLYYLRRLVFEDVPFDGHSLLYSAPVFWLWMIGILCLMFGVFTRGAAVLNYLMTLATFSTFHFWEYHVDYIYTGVNCFLMFIPVGRVLSVDAWWQSRSNQRLGLTAPPFTVRRLYYDALIFVGIALVYFDSVFYKLASPMWLSGLGLWRPASLPHNTYWDVGWLLDMKPLMIGLSYVTLAFECAFVVLMWFDRLRPWLFLVGIGLHLGIAVMFPIPWFGFAVFSLYLLLVPDRWWSAIVPRRVFTTAEDAHRVPLIVRGNEFAPTCVLALTIIITGWQLVMTSAADLSRQITAQFGGERMRQSVEYVARRTHRPARVLFGVTRHPVFMDFHFDGYEAFYTLVALNSDGTKTWLPMAAPSGQGRLGWSGRLWVNWTWRVSNPQPDPDTMTRGFRAVTAWWLGQQGRDRDAAQFAILRRQCDPCEGWSRGYYQRQLKHDWKQVGTVQWHQGKFHSSLQPQLSRFRLNRPHEFQGISSN